VSSLKAENGNGPGLQRIRPVGPTPGTWGFITRWLAKDTSGIHLFITAEHVKEKMSTETIFSLSVD
jgi:hypothetical protein